VCGCSSAAVRFSKWIKYDLYCLAASTGLSYNTREDWSWWLDSIISERNLVSVETRFTRWRTESCSESAVHSGKWGESYWCFTHTGAQAGNIWGLLWMSSFHLAWRNSQQFLKCYCQPGPKCTYDLRTILRQFLNLRQFYDNWRIHRTFTTISRPVLRKHLTITF